MGCPLPLRMYEIHPAYYENDMFHIDRFANSIE